jgi:2-dehydro-3-deoxygluconokinase
MAQKNFLAIGEAMIEMAVVGPDTYRRGFAGDTFNTAWYAAKILPESWKMSYFTGLGLDKASLEMRSFAESANVDMHAVREVEGKTVGLYMIHLDAGERSFSYWRSDSAARQMAGDVDVLAKALDGADVLFFSGITMAVIQPADRNKFLETVEKARRSGKTVIYDPNQRLRLWADQSEMTKTNMQAAAVSDIVLPSFDEEQLFYGDKTQTETIARYLAVGVNTVIAKNGAGEIIAQTRGQAAVSVQPDAIENVVDSTAAGDSFNAGFCVSFLNGAPLDQAIAAGSKLAAQVVQSHGALVAPTE